MTSDVKFSHMLFFLLNPQSGYLKIDAYLLNLVSHDFKLSDYFLLIKVINTDVFLTLNSFRKRFQSTTHSVNAGNFST